MRPKIQQPEIDEALATFKGVFGALEAMEKLRAMGITKYNGKLMTRNILRGHLVRLLKEGKIRKVGRAWEMVNEDGKTPHKVKVIPKGLPYAPITADECRRGVKVKFHPVMWRPFYIIQEIRSKAYTKPYGVTYVRITGDRREVPLDSLEVL